MLKFDNNIFQCFSSYKPPGKDSERLGSFHCTLPSVEFLLRTWCSSCHWKKPAWISGPICPGPFVVITWIQHLMHFGSILFNSTLLNEHIQQFMVSKKQLGNNKWWENELISPSAPGVSFCWPRWNVCSARVSRWAWEPTWRAAIRPPCSRPCEPRCWHPKAFNFETWDGVWFVSSVWNRKIRLKSFVDLFCFVFLWLFFVWLLEISWFKGCES